VALGSPGKPQTLVFVGTRTLCPDKIIAQDNMPFALFSQFVVLDGVIWSELL
tara:strand:+ start:1026 stop:1181 length:156 start_codon:yes stop_codon:yes gene_type:complete